MGIRTRAFLFACGLAAAPLAHAQHTHGKPGVSRVELGASAAFDANGALWAVYKEGGQVVLRRSADAGASWAAAQAVNPASEAIEASSDSRPKIAVGTAGEIYVSWTRALSKFHTGEVRFARSIDGGKTFSEPLTVHSDRQETTHRFDTLAVNREGKVFVAWIDARDGRPSLYFAVSSDRGATFPRDQLAATSSCECCRLALAPLEDGSVAAMWRDVFEPDIRDHALVRLGADGVPGAVRRATFDDWHTSACPHHGPSLAKDGAGRLHAVWYSATPGKEGVYYGRLRDGAVDGQRRVGGQTAEHADIAASGKRVAIAWKEFDGTRSRLRAMRSDDGGLTWRDTDLAASDGPSGQPLVLVRDGVFHVFWNTADKPLLVVPLP